MNYRTLIRRESWMHPTEWRVALRQRRALLQSFAERNVPLTPYLALRIQQYLTALLFAQRVETAILSPWQDPEHPENWHYPVPTDEQHERIAALREQVLLILLEIEACAANNGLPDPAWLEQRRIPQPATTPEPDDIASDEPDTAETAAAESTTDENALPAPSPAPPPAEVPAPTPPAPVGRMGRKERRLMAQLEKQRANQIPRVA